MRSLRNLPTNSPSQCLLPDNSISHITISLLVIYYSYLYTQTPELRVQASTRRSHRCNYHEPAQNLGLQLELALFQVLVCLKFHNNLLVVGAKLVQVMSILPVSTLRWATG